MSPSLRDRPPESRRPAPRAATRAARGESLAQGRDVRGDRRCASFFRQSIPDARAKRKQ